MEKEREKLLLEKIKTNKIEYRDLNCAEDFLFLFDHNYKFQENDMGNIIYDFGDVHGEIVEEKRGEKHRWHTEIDIIIKFNDRYFKFSGMEGNTELQESEYSTNIIEVFLDGENFKDKEIATEIVALPKMEFIFDTQKIVPAKIDKSMIDFEKTEEDVKKIEELYDVVFTDLDTVKQAREKVASIKANADKFKKDLMDFLNKDTNEVNKKLIEYIKRVEAVRKHLQYKEKELDTKKTEEIKSIKELIFKDRKEYLFFLIENPKWKNKTFSINKVESEIQEQYNELIKKEEFIKKELEKANAEISFVITFESIKYLIKEEYGTISEIITNKKNEIKATEENLKRKAEEQAKKEAEEKLRKEQEQQKEVEETKNETVPTAPEAKIENTEKVEKDTYICIKVNGLTEETVKALQKVIKEHNLKYIKEMR